jgi:hypothetical protein
MSDGTPRGYQRVSFNGGDYSIDGYQVLGAGASYQMRIIAPDEVSAGESGATAFQVNLFSAGPRARVRARVGGAGEPWRDLERVREPDPHRVVLHERDRSIERPWRPLGASMPCPHLWAGLLPENLPVGTHVIEILADDGFGGSRSDLCPIRIA